MNERILVKHSHVSWRALSFGGASSAPVYLEMQTIICYSVVKDNRITRGQILLSKLCNILTSAFVVSLKRWGCWAPFQVFLGFKTWFLVILWSSDTSMLLVKCRGPQIPSCTQQHGWHRGSWAFSWVLCPAVSTDNHEATEAYKTPPPLPSPYHWLVSSPSVLTPRPEVSSPGKRGPGGSGGCPDGSLSPPQPPLWPERRWSLSVCL